MERKANKDDFTEAEKRGQETIGKYRKKFENLEDGDVYALAKHHHNSGSLKLPRCSPMKYKAFEIVNGNHSEINISDIGSLIQHNERVLRLYDKDTYEYMCVIEQYKCPPGCVICWRKEYMLNKK